MQPEGGATFIAPLQILFLPNYLLNSAACTASKCFDFHSLTHLPNALLFISEKSSDIYFHFISAVFTTSIYVELIIAVPPVIDFAVTLRLIVHIISHTLEYVVLFHLPRLASVIIFFQINAVTCHK